jgi:hypothetical protein
MSGGLRAIGWQPLSQKLQVASIRIPDSRSLIFVYDNEATELVEELEEVFVAEKIVEMLMDQCTQARGERVLVWCTVSLDTALGIVTDRRCPHATTRDIHRGPLARSAQSDWRGAH